MHDGMRWGLGIGGGLVAAVLLALALLHGPCAPGDDGGAVAADAALAAPGEDVARAGPRPERPGGRTQGRGSEPGAGAVPALDAGRLLPPGTPGTGALAGLVLDRDGLPAAGVVVTVRPDEPRAPWERFGPRRARAPAGLAAKRVDPDGFFRFEGLPAGTVAVEAGGAGFVAAEQRGVAIAPDAEAWVEFALDAGLSISGRVTDREGRAIAGAEVSAWSRGRGGAAAATRADGSYEVEGLRAGTYDLEADADGYVAARREDVRAGTSGVDFRLGRSGTLAGRVVWRGSGSPIEGAEVRAVAPGARGEWMPPGRGPGGRGPFGGRGAGPSGVTGADGRFELRDVEPGRWVVEADAADRAPSRSREVTLEPGARVDDLLVELAEGARVTGIVVTDAGGRPVADATVSIEGGGRGPGRGRGLGALFAGRGGAPEPEPDGEWSARTDGAGRFELRHVAAGSRTVVATHPSHPPARRTIAIPDTGDLAGVELRMPAGGAIAGTVTDRRRGAAVAEAFVVAVPAGGGGVGGPPGGGMGGPAGGTQVGAGGSYRLEGLEAGRYDVMVVVPPAETGGRWRGPEFSTPKEAVVRSGETTTVDFLLGGGTTVSGLVTQAGAPVPGASVSFQPEEEMLGGRRNTVAGDDGRYLLEDVAPGPYLVRVERAPLRVVIPDVPEHELNLELPAGAIAGFVRDAAGGAGIEDARIFARALGAGGDAPSPASIAGRARSSPDGSFEVADLAPGSYELQVSHPQYSPGRAVVTLPASGRLDGVEVRLEPGVKIRGRVLDESGAPVADAFVLLLDPQSGAPVPGDPRGRMTGTDGAFELAGVAPGTWSLVASAAGYAPSAPVVVDATAGAENVVLRVTPGGRVEATVVESSGAPAAGVPVTLVESATGRAALPGMPGPGARRGPTTDDAGRVVFEHVRAGAWTLRATPAERAGTQVQIVVEEGRTAAATATLPP